MYFCGEALSYTLLNTAHLNLDSHNRCKGIPHKSVQDLKTGEKKKWKSETIKMCKNINITGSSFQDIYAGHSLYTTDELLEMLEEYNRSYQGKLHVDIKIK